MSFNKSEALDAAKQYVLQRNLPAALQIYQKVVQVDPADLSAMNTLGDLYASTGNIQQAIDHFSRLATIYIDGGSPRKAIAALKKIIAVDPANIETAIKLADLYAEAGLPSEARQHYLQIAEALMRKGQRLDALNVYTKVVELDPMNTPTRIRLAELCLREGLNDQTYDAFMIAADQLAQKGEHRRSLNAYNEAISIKPENAEALTGQRKLMGMLGISDRGQSETSGNGEPAGEKPSRAQTAPLGSQTPSNDKPKNNEGSFVVQEISKAEILVAYGQVTQALRMLKDVLRENPDSIDVHVKLKDIYLRTGMMAEAATECRELERIHQSRGESDRARDYAVRASRLTNLLDQPSGDLDGLESNKTPSPQINAQPPVVASQNPASIETQVSVPPLVAQQVESNPVIEPQKIPAEPQVKATPVVATKKTPPAGPQVNAPSPAVSSQKPSPAVPEANVPRPVVASEKPLPAVGQIKAQPFVAPQNPSPGSAHVKTSPPAVAPQEPEPRHANLKVAQDRKPIPVTTRLAPPFAQPPKVQISVADENHPAVVVAETRPELRVDAPSVPVEKPAAIVPAETDDQSLREASSAVVSNSAVGVEFAPVLVISWLAKNRKAVIAAGALVLLSMSAVIGGFVYFNSPDHQSPTLAVTAPPVSSAPPAETAAGQMQTQVAQSGTPANITATAAAAPEVPTRRESKDPEPTKTKQPPAPVPQPVSRPVNPAPSPAPVLPRASVSPDTIGADNKAPSGVPVEVPIGAIQPAEPPAKAVRHSPGVVMGSAIKKVEPTYPSPARSAGQSGTVKVEVSINERGDVTSARALSGPALLQNAAVNAARAWKFKASTLGGVPVTTTTTIVFNFKL